MVAEEKINEPGGEERQDAPGADAAKNNTENGAADENRRLNRDAAKLAKQKLEADGPARETGGETGGKADAARTEETKERKKRREREEKERQKQEAREAKERQRQEAQEERARQKRLAGEERRKRQYEKKEAKSVARQEIKAEWKSLWHVVEFSMLATFIVLAIDQAGIYGFLFVWLFVAVMIASVALLLLGIVRAVRKKRCGMIFGAAVLGIIACTVWFIFLVSSWGLGLGPAPV